MNAPARVSARIVYISGYPLRMNLKCFCQFQESLRLRINCMSFHQQSFIYTSVELQFDKCTRNGFSLFGRSLYTYVPRNVPCQRIASLYIQINDFENYFHRIVSFLERNFYELCSVYPFDALPVASGTQLADYTVTLLGGLRTEENTHIFRCSFIFHVIFVHFNVFQAILCLRMN